MAYWKPNKTLRFSLDIDNLFDKTYYNTVSGTWGGNYYGEPRSAFLTLKGTY